MNILKKFFVAIAKRTTNAPRTREFRTLEDFRGGTFFDAFADAFTAPEDLPLHQPDSIPMGRIRDARHIRENISTNNLRHPD